MSHRPWNVPPVLQAVLRLQKLNADLKKIKLETQLKAATKLLDRQLERAKRK